MPPSLPEENKAFPGPGRSNLMPKMPQYQDNPPLLFPPQPPEIAQLLLRGYTTMECPYDWGAGCMGDRLRSDQRPDAGLGNSHPIWGYQAPVANPANVADKGPAKPRGDAEFREIQLPKLPPELHSQLASVPKYLLTPPPCQSEEGHASNINFGPGTSRPPAPGPSSGRSRR